MYVFECHTHNKNALVFFVGQYVDGSSEFLTSAIQNAYRDNLTPELVLLIYPEYLKTEITNFLDKASTVVELTRHQNTPTACLSFDIKGELLLTKEINNRTALTFSFETLQKDLTKAGYDSLMKKRANDVLVKAPAGTNFVKPSGKSLEEFIYASQLARSNDEYQFLAMSLLGHAPTNVTLDSIYIDTASISTIAEAVIYYLTKFKNDSCKSIGYRSFSSYSGLEEQGKPDNALNSWVIISASASTSMGKKLVKEWNIKPEQVITILSYEEPLNADDTNIGNSVVFCVDKYSKRDKKSFSPTKVQVQGENFSVEVSNPNKILLLKKFKPEYVDRSIFEYHNARVFSINKANYPVHISYQKLKLHHQTQPTDYLTQWIKQVVEWTLPRNLNTIIAPNDIDSNELVNDFKVAMAASGFNISNVTILNSDSLHNLGTIKDSSVLVLSSAISSGRYFVDINRALRLADHKGMRTFATPFIVSASSNQFSSLVTSLTQGTNGFKYNFLSFNKILVGSKTLCSWKKELETVRNIINFAEAEDPELQNPGVRYWITRKIELEKVGDGLNGRVGIHSLNVEAYLKLARDFVFWPDKYNEYDPEAVYVTVASILQKLRDNEISGANLSGNVYQHCVLDPENFVRFNDSLLQSCLWRCAIPSELDFRRSDSLSDDLHRILCKLFMSSDTERGATSIDFLISLAMRWIKISDDAIQKVIIDAETHLQSDQAKLLIGFLKNEFRIT